MTRNISEKRTELFLSYRLFNNHFSLALGAVSHQGRKDSMDVVLKNWVKYGAQTTD